MLRGIRSGSGGRLILRLAVFLFVGAAYSSSVCQWHAEGTYPVQLSIYSQHVTNATDGRQVVADDSNLEIVVSLEATFTRLSCDAVTGAVYVLLLRQRDCFMTQDEVVTSCGVSCFWDILAGTQARFGQDSSGLVRGTDIVLSPLNDVLFKDMASLANTCVDDSNTSEAETGTQSTLQDTLDEVSNMFANVARQISMRVDELSYDQPVVGSLVAGPSDASASSQSENDAYSFDDGVDSIVDLHYVLNVEPHLQPVVVGQDVGGDALPNVALQYIEKQFLVPSTQALEVQGGNTLDFGAGQLGTASFDSEGRLLFKTTTMLSEVPLVVSSDQHSPSSERMIGKVRCAIGVDPTPSTFDVHDDVTLDDFYPGGFTTYMTKIVDDFHVARKLFTSDIGFGDYYNQYGFGGTKPTHKRSLASLNTQFEAQHPKVQRRQMYESSWGVDLFERSDTSDPNGEDAAFLGGKNLGVTLKARLEAGVTSDYDGFTGKSFFNASAGAIAGIDANFFGLAGNILTFTATGSAGFDKKSADLITRKLTLGYRLTVIGSDLTNPTWEYTGQTQDSCTGVTDKATMPICYRTKAMKLWQLKVPLPYIFFAMFSLKIDFTLGCQLMLCGGRQVRMLGFGGYAQASLTGSASLGVSVLVIKADISAALTLAEPTVMGAGLIPLNRLFQQSAVIPCTYVSPQLDAFRVRISIGVSFKFLFIKFKLFRYIIWESGIVTLYSDVKSYQCKYVDSNGNPMPPEPVVQCSGGTDLTGRAQWISSDYNCRDGSPNSPCGGAVPLVSGGVYTINSNQGLAVDAIEETQNTFLQLAPADSTSTTQNFTIILVDDDEAANYYEIHSYVKDLCWDIPGWVIKEGTQVILWPCNKQNNQQFILKEYNGLFRIISKFADNIVLTSKPNIDGKRPSLTILNENDVDQLFSLRNLEAGTYDQMLKQPGRYLTPYEANSRCSWVVPLPDTDRNFSVAFSLIETEKDADLIKIYMCGSSTPVDIFSGLSYDTKKTYPYPTGCGKFSVNFTSDSYVDNKGFFMTYAIGGYIPPAPRPTDPVRVRIVGNLTTYVGRVEVAVTDDWGTICDDDWDDDKTRQAFVDVACRSAGYTDLKPGAGSVIQLPSQYGDIGSETQTIWMSRVHCDGSEANLVYCRFEWAPRNCKHVEDVGILCGDPPPSRSEIRLVDRSGMANTLWGRLEIKHNDIWGSVAAGGLTDLKYANNLASVVCNELKPAVQLGDAPPLNGYFYFSSFFRPTNQICYKNESQNAPQLWVESHYLNDWPSQPCERDFLMVDTGETTDGVRWYIAKSKVLQKCVTFDLELVYLYDCFSPKDSHDYITQRFQLLPTKLFGSYDDVIVIRTHVAGVWYCAENPGIINHGAGYYLRMSRCKDVADDGQSWLVHNAGTTNAPTLLFPYDTPQGPEYQPVFLQFVRCEGGESYLDLCRADRSVYKKNAMYEDDIGVDCKPEAPPPPPYSPPPPPGPRDVRIRLVQMPGFPMKNPRVNAGRVEVLFDGVWGTVAANGLWPSYSRDGAAFAETVCYQLAKQDPSLGGFFPWVLSPFLTPDGDPNSPIWMDGVRCNDLDDNSNLGTCLSFGWNETIDADHAGDVGVVCGDEWPTDKLGPQPDQRPSIDYVDVRLVNRTGKTEGNEPVDDPYIVQVFWNGTWGTVCDNGLFDVNNNPTKYGTGFASTICRSFGLGQGVLLIRSKMVFDPDDTYFAIPIVMDDVRCSGGEDNVAQCSQNGWGASRCTHFQDVAVRCFSLPTFPKFAPTPKSGV